MIYHKFKIIYNYNTIHTKLVVSHKAEIHNYRNIWQCERRRGFKLKNL